MENFLIGFFTIGTFVCLVLMMQIVKDCEIKKNINPWTFDELVAMTLIAIKFVNGSKWYNKEVSKFSKLYNRDLSGVMYKIEEIRDYNQNMNFVFDEKFDKAFDVAVKKIDIY